MRFSNFFIPTQKNVSSEVKMKSHELMIKSGMIRQETSGIYTWLPLGFRVLKKIIRIIEYYHEKNFVNQILMPTIQNAEIWKISDRYDSYGKEMLKINDRNNKELLYGPTNEEMVTAIGKQYIKSYKTLPRKFYHIQSKFRDEIRPRFGVMRAREFLMKDAYSFDIDEENGEKTYLDFYKMYLEIFKNLNIPVIPVRAPSGEIGGNMSHEFHLIVESGESDIFVSEEVFEKDFENLSLDEVLNLNSYTDEYYSKISDVKGVKKFKSIELAHIFLFGTKYSNAFNFQIDSDNGKFTPFMGSYGIGISRIPAAYIEHSNDSKGIIWHESLAPFSIHLLNLLPNDNNCKEQCKKIYNELKINNVEVIYDDRDERPGKKFSDADLIGTPIQVIIGNQYKNKNEISIINRSDKKEKILKAEALQKFLINMIT